MNIGTDERAPVTGSVVIGDVLDREERAREAVRELDERLNLPGGDVPMGSDRVDERALAQMGRQEYLEHEMRGEGELGMERDAGNEATIAANWEEMFGKKFPYDIGEGNLESREIELQMAERDIERGYLGDMARGEIYSGMKVEGKGDPIEVFVDLTEIKNQRVRGAIEHLGGHEYVGRLWGDAKKLTLYSPYVEGLDWVVKVEDGRKRFLAMSLSDLERMFFVDGEKERMRVVLPKPGDGTYAGARDLILAIKRLKVEGGTILPAKIDLALELLR